MVLKDEPQESEDPEDRATLVINFADDREAVLNFMIDHQLDVYTPSLIYHAVAVGWLEFDVSFLEYEHVERHICARNGQGITNVSLAASQRMPQVLLGIYNMINVLEYFPNKVNRYVALNEVQAATKGFEDSAVQTEMETCDAIVVSCIMKVCNSQCQNWLMDKIVASRHRANCDS